MVEFVKHNGINIPVFPYVPTEGQVVLCFEDKKYEEKDGIESPHKALKIRRAVIVSVGPNDKLEMDPRLKVGTYVLMPAVGKQLFRIGSVDFYVCHHLEIKLIDPVLDLDLLAKQFEAHFENLPEEVQIDFFRKERFFK